MKFTKKIPRFFIPLIVISFILIVSILFVFLSNLLRDKQMEILTVKRQLAVTEIEKDFTEVESVLTSLSSVIKQNPNDPNLLEIMDEIDQEYQTITQIYFGQTDGSYVITVDFDEPEGFDIRQRPWYLTAISAGELTYTDAYIDAVIESTIMTIAMPIYQDDQFIGVLGADIEVDTMAQFISDFIDEDIGYAFLLDENGYVLAHSLLDSNILSLVSYQTYDLPDELLLEDEGVTRTVNTMDYKGKIAYQSITHSNFVFGIFMTNTELNQSIRTLTIVSLAVVALALAIIIVLFFSYHYGVQKPLNELITDIEKIDISKNASFRLEAHDKKGFKAARLALNRLIDMSVDYQTQLEESYEELSIENQKIELLLSSSSDIVFVLDNFKRYINIYGDTHTIFGLDKSEFIGKTHEEVFGGKYAKQREVQYDKALEGETVLYSWENTIDGKTYYYETVINPIFNHSHEITGIVGVARDITEQENRYKELVYISTHDYLTELYNRKVYDEKLNKLNQDQDYPFALINMDVNGLKLINDAYGHRFGDIAIKKTADILRKTVRKEDTVCRVSGDEFTVIMPKATKKEVDHFKNKLKKALRNIKIINIELSLAVGYYIQTDNKTTVDEMRKLAENNMYKQKVLERKSVKNKAISAILKTLTDKFDVEKRHSERVKNLSIEIGKALNLDEESIKALGTAAMFHDIGKISIPDEILNKPDKLTKEEYEIIKTHTTTGYDILNTADEYSDLAIHASLHHERYDGLGYPNGLKGDQIPLFSRIIAVADAYEAMTSDRPYRKKMSKEKAIQEIIDYSGTQFDPLIAKVFIEDVLSQEETL